MQVELFENIKPLFAKKPLIVCVNKVDVTRISELSEERQKLFEVFKEEEISVLEMSTFTEEGLMKVKTAVRKISRFFIYQMPVDNKSYILLTFNPYLTLVRSL